MNKINQYSLNYQRTDKKKLNFADVIIKQPFY